jgi:tetratricopeptide (TPR) repeat protein
MANRRNQGGSTGKGDGSWIASRFMRGVEAHRAGRLGDAEADYSAVLSRMPDHPGALLWLGVVMLQRGSHARAVGLLSKAARVDASNASAHAHLGIALRESGRNDDALACLDRALTLRAEYPEALVNRGIVLRELGRLDEAIATLERAIALNDAMPDAWTAMANVLRERQEPAHALAAYDRALSLQPQSVAAHAGRGGALNDLRRFDEALAAFDAALALAPALAETHFNRANVLRNLGRAEEAIEGYDRALRLRPAHADALASRGSALLDLCRFDDALAAFEQARRIDPSHVEAHRYEAICRLTRGDFARGFELFEWRWRNPALGKSWRGPDRPRWGGERIDGTLLVWGEQGIGDQLLYLGLVRELLPLARRVVLAVEPRLTTLVARSFPGVEVIPLDTASTTTDCAAHVPMGSLGRYLRSGATAPERSPPAAYLVPDRTRQAMLRERLAASGKRTCAISWFSGSEIYGRFKSVPFHCLHPLLAQAGLRFVDLQYRKAGADDAGMRADEPGNDGSIALDRFSDIDAWADLDGLAALIAACDVVVTVSNTTAHLAGALGVPTLLMLPYSRGSLWYWHEGRNDSPWYPSIRIVRQRTPGDWDDVVTRVIAALQRA